MFFFSECRRARGRRRRQNGRRGRNRRGRKNSTQPHSYEVINLHLYHNGWMRKKKSIIILLKFTVRKKICVLYIFLSSRDGDTASHTKVHLEEEEEEGEKYDEYEEEEGGKRLSDSHYHIFRTTSILIVSLKLNSHSILYVSMLLFVYHCGIKEGNTSALLFHENSSHMGVSSCVFTLSLMSWLYIQEALFENHCALKGRKCKSVIMTLTKPSNSKVRWPLGIMTLWEEGRSLGSQG